jgi:CubicO group peptidase (beta-lactamase class C family)
MTDATYWTGRMRDLAGQAGIQGAVLGIWADGQETVAAHGVLNSATGVEVTPDSLFQIASITKVWTATMIMQLIDEGRLSLGTTVAQVLPGVRICTSDVSGQVTIEHLLTHTSGIEGDIFIDTGRGGVFL